MERRRFSQTMASEWQTAFLVSHKMPWCVLLTAVKNYNKSLEKLQDFFFKTEIYTKTSCFKTETILSSRRLDTKTLVLRTTSLPLAHMHILNRARHWSIDALFNAVLNVFITERRE